MNSLFDGIIGRWDLVEGSKLLGGITLEGISCLQLLPFAVCLLSAMR
jgi:hypothetical protein